jgi:hypothetical protein
MTKSDVTAWNYLAQEYGSVLLPLKMLSPVLGTPVCTHTDLTSPQNSNFFKVSEITYYKMGHTSEGFVPLQICTRSSWPEAGLGVHLILHSVRKLLFGS